jgi:IS5 family transposase
MITYDRLAGTPKAFPALTGLTRDEFDRLFGAFEVAVIAHRAASTHTKRGSRRRKRAAGAGHPHSLGARTRLLLALVWLRVYPTYELLGWLFGLDRSNAWHNAQDVLEILDTMTDFPFDRPDPDRRKLQTAEAVMEAFPEVRVIIDAKEQALRRPGGWEAQKPFYSGKKKRHTVKNQVACTPGGRIVSVSATAPGRTHDLTVLRYSGLLDRLPAGAGVMTDKGYTGVAADAGTRAVVIPVRATRNLPLTDDQKASNRVINRHRVVVEHVMAQLSRFQALRQTFRGVLGRHTRAFRVVALLVDRRSADTPLKTYPTAA